MASATGVSAIQADTNKLSINGDMEKTTPNGNAIDTSADYWTDLLRKNLSKAQSIAVADSDAEDSSSPQIDEEIFNAPRRKSPRDALAREVAARLYPAPPDSLAPIIKYEKDIVTLRSM